MAVKQGNSPKVKNTKARRGVQPGDKVVNRKGGGKSPVAVVTNPARILGIRKATLAAALNFFGESLTTEIEIGIRLAVGLGDGFEHFEESLTSAERQSINKALVYATKVVPDSAKLPEPIVAPKEVNEKRRPHRTQQPRPQIVPLRRTVSFGDAPVSQLEQILGQQTEEKPVVPVDATDVRIARVPAKANNDALNRVLEATRN